MNITFKMNCFGFIQTMNVILKLEDITIISCRHSICNISPSIEFKAITNFI